MPGPLINDVIDMLRTPAAITHLGSFGSGGRMEVSHPDRTVCERAAADEIAKIDHMRSPVIESSSPIAGGWRIRIRWYGLD